MPPARIAVIGAGIAGLGAAWSLRNRNVTLFESGARPGGHARTLDVSLDETSIAVDAGFIVFNRPNYPNFIRLLHHLQIETIESAMSFSVSVDNGRLEYAAASLASLFAQRRNLASPRHWGMLLDILRFFREAQALFDHPEASDLTLGAFLDRGGYGTAFVQDHLLPMAAAIWSAPMQQLRGFPAQSFARFFRNHGLLSLTRRSVWRTVAGGSRRYVDRLIADLPAVVLSAGIEAVRPTETGVAIRRHGAWERFDAAVLACPADQALALLDASPTEREILSGFRFQPNIAYLHRDPRLMPRRRRAWASWNHLSRSVDGRRDEAADVAVTYWMNRLQPLPTAADIFVTLNPFTPPHDDLTHARLRYAHPIFDHRALAAQARLPHLQGCRNIFYAGAWTGYGFHEDGLRSGFQAGLALGGALPWRQETEARQAAE